LVLFELKQYTSTDAFFAGTTTNDVLVGGTVEINKRSKFSSMSCAIVGFPNYLWMFTCGGSKRYRTGQSNSLRIVSMLDYDVVFAGKMQTDFPRQDGKDPFFSDSGVNPPDAYAVTPIRYSIQVHKPVKDTTDYGFIEIIRVMTVEYNSSRGILYYGKFTTRLTGNENGLLVRTIHTYEIYGTDDIGTGVLYSGVESFILTDEVLDPFTMNFTELVVTKTVITDEATITYTVQDLGETEKIEGGMKEVYHHYSETKVTVESNIDSWLCPQMNISSLNTVNFVATQVRYYYTGKLYSWDIVDGVWQWRPWDPNTGGEWGPDPEGSYVNTVNLNGGGKTIEGKGTDWINVYSFPLMPIVTIHQTTSYDISYTETIVYTEATVGVDGFPILPRTNAAIVWVRYDQMWHTTNQVYLSGTNLDYSIYSWFSFAAGLFTAVLFTKEHSAFKVLYKKPISIINTVSGITSDDSDEIPIISSTRYTKVDLYAAPWIDATVDIVAAFKLLYPSLDLDYKTAQAVYLYKTGDLV